MFLGFAVLAGIWPLHTWAPTGHVAAPTAASMLLAGIVMKLGAYGAFRVSMNLFPEGFHIWSGTIATLAVIGIVYAAAIALRQRDLKFVIGYSSVSHMGFVLLGLATAQALGAGGAVLQMFSHGIIAGLLFAVVGRMIYDRTHTRDLTILPGLALNREIPFAAFTFVLASAAAMGISGFSGFAAEITIFIGTWRAYPAVVMIARFGMVSTAAYMLRALRKSFFGGTDTDPVSELPHFRSRKKLGRLLLCVVPVVGLFPNLLLDGISGGRDDALVEQMNYLTLLKFALPEAVVTATALAS